MRSPPALQAKPHAFVSCMQTIDVWFNGRNERDPRLGIILSPSRGHMWLDSAARPGVRGGDIVSQPFDCRPDGAVY